MKKCPICDLNYIKDDAECCDLCREQSTHHQKHSQGTHSIGEYFTITNETDWYRNHFGFKAYNAAGSYVGIIFATDDKRTPAYGMCEVSFLEEYHHSYGEWHRIISNGERIAYAELQKILSNQLDYRMYID